MDPVRIANSLRERAPWEVAQKILAELDVPRGMGWEKTLEKLDDGAGLAEDAGENLLDALKEHLLCGEKLIRLYEVSPEEMPELRVAAAAAQVNEASPFRATYPLSVTSETMQAERATRASIVSVERLEGGTAIVFASVRSQEVREPVERDAFSDDVVDALSDYEEVVGIRHIRRQAMDVVWVPDDGAYVDVRIDFPKGMHQEQGKFAHEKIREALAIALGRDFLFRAVNLFPLVDRLYRSAEGTVVELAFGTSTGSLKHEKMRRTQLCLREETYHVGGTAALTVPIAPFRISIQWDRQHGEISSKPELSLPGVSRMTHLVNAPLHEAVVRRCIDLDDYNFVRERVVSSIDSVPHEVPADAE